MLARKDWENPLKLGKSRDYPHIPGPLLINCYKFVLFFKSSCDRIYLEIVCPEWGNFPDPWTL